WGNGTIRSLLPLCWPRHALTQSCSRFRPHYPPHWGHSARSHPSSPSALTPTSAPLTPFPRHPRLRPHLRPPEISISLLLPTRSPTASANRAFAPASRHKNS